MNKQRGQMEKMVALVMLAFSIALLTGEGMRDALYGEPIEGRARVLPTERIPD